MKPPSGPKKQTQNKPNFKPCPERIRMGQFPKGQNELKNACRKIRLHPCYLTCTLEIARTLELRYNNLQSQTMLKQRKSANWLNERSVLRIL